MRSIVTTLATVVAVVAAMIGHTGVTAELPRTASGPQGDTWASISQLPDFSGAWYRANFLDPKSRPAPPPFTVEYAAIARSAASDATINNNALHCLPDGVPMMMSAPYSFEFLLTPGRVTIDSENGEIRRVYTDGRKHPDDPDPTFEGHSIGHWEQNVLVVDTIGLIKDAELTRGVHGGGSTHVVERIFKKDPGTIQIDTTVTDPAAFTAPYQYSHTYVRTPVGMIEFVCEQNNKGNNEFDSTSSKQ